MEIYDYLCKMYNNVSKNKLTLPERRCDSSSLHHDRVAVIVATACRLTRKLHFLWGISVLGQFLSMGRRKLATQREWCAGQQLEIKRKITEKLFKN